MLLGVERLGKSSCSLKFDDYCIDFNCDEKTHSFVIKSNKVTTTNGSRGDNSEFSRINNLDLDGTLVTRTNDGYLINITSHKTVNSNECYILRLRSWYCYVFCLDGFVIDFVYVFNTADDSLILKRQFM